jgi:hypothetical protein
MADAPIAGEAAALLLDVYIASANHFGRRLTVSDAPRGKLYIDPALPDWLPDVTLTDLRLGRQCFDIRFWRDGKDTLFKVLKGEHDSIELRSIANSANMPAG